MADKATALSIVLRTVDKATAGINAVNKRLDALTKPTRDLGKALGDLREKSGMDAVADGFKGVGGAVTDLLGKVAMVGGVVVAAALGLKSLVDEFATLGHTAARAGVEADFLAGLRYAAGKSGVAVEALDAGVTTLTQNMGQAKAGTGRMLKFLNQVSPALARQVVAAHSTGEAIGLLADAMAKLPDPARRAALAQKTLGDSALAPLFALGSKGIQELMGSYAGLAGSQGDAVKEALSVEDSLKDLGAASDGVKAALVVGLAPALKGVVEDLKEWLVAHRGDIKAWAEDIGKKLPGAIDVVVTAVKGAAADVAGFVDGIGGLKVAAVLAAAVIAGPLIASIVSLGIAIATTPVGWILAGFAAIAAGAYFVVKNWDVVTGKLGAVVDVVMYLLEPFLFFPLLIVRHWGQIKDFFVKLWDGIKWAFSGAWDVIKPIVDAVVAGAGAVKDAAKFLLPGQDEQRANALAVAASEGISLDTQAAAAAAAPPAQKATVKIELPNAPKGTRASVDPASTADVDLSVGYQMGFGA